MQDQAAVPALTIDQLPSLHALTKDVSTFCRKQLKGYLETLAPLFRPRRFLGDMMEGAGRESVVGADRNVAELRDLYRRVSGRPFDLKPDLATPLESVSTQLQLYEWEYLHDAQTERGRRTITVNSPMTWVVAYSSTYSLGMLRHVLAGDEERNPDAVRAFVLRACLMHQLFLKFPALTELLAGLRYHVEVRRLPELGELPLLTVSAPTRTVRPPDHLLLVASGVAGGSRFAEVVDRERFQHLTDPFRQALERVAQAHGELL